MDEAVSRNAVELRGALAGAPRFSHMSRGERFFVFPVETRRLSGVADVINVVAREALLAGLEAAEAERVVRERGAALVQQQARRGAQAGDNRVRAEPLPGGGAGRT